MPTHHLTPFQAAFNRRRFLQAGSTMALLALPAILPACARGEATPVSGAATRPSVLVDMLRLIPASLYVETKGTWVWDYMDQAQQLVSLEVAAPTVDEPVPPGYLPATYPLWTSTQAYLAAIAAMRDSSILDALVAEIGFFPMAVGQCLAVGGPPESVSIYRGGIDLERIGEIWSTHGYETVSTPGDVQYWTLGDRNLDDPVQKYTFGELNNLAVIDDKVVASGSPRFLERIIAVHTGSEPSIMESPEIAAAVTGMPPETVSAIGGWPLGVPAAGSLDRFEDIREERKSIIAEAGPMPLYLTIVAGVTAGLSAPVKVDGTPTPVEPDPGTGLAIVRLGTASEADAEQAAQVAAYRWQAATSVATNKPFTDSMEVLSARADDTVAELVFDRVRRPAAWREFFVHRDTFPFAVG